jgi:hypothetical protein
MWIVLDAENDVVVMKGFAESEDAVTWIAREIEHESHDVRLELLRRCVVVPHDPERDGNPERDG